MSRAIHSHTGQTALIGLLLILSLTAAAAASTFMVIDEDDLAAKIVQANSQNATTLVLPATITLTKPQPAVLAQLLLTSGADGAVISCQTRNFTALTVSTSIFGMVGLTWVGCGTVLELSQLPIDGSDINIDSCRFLGNRIDPTKVGYTLIKYACCKF